MQAPAVRYVNTRDGFSIAYTIEGTGQPLIYLPNAINHIQNVRRTAISQKLGLAARFRLIRYDHRGQGLSSRNLSPEHTWKDYQSDIESLTGVLPFERVTMMAAGEFSAAAIPFVVDHPERIQALVLFNPLLGAADEFPGRLQLVENNWGWFLEASAKLVRADEDPIQVREELREATTQEDFILLLRSFQRQDVASALGRVKVPTLVLCGRGREFVAVSSDAAKRVASAIQGARLQEVDSWEAVSSAVHDFLASIPISDQPVADAEAKLSARLIPRLSTRELEVLRLVVAGKTNREIGAELSISWHTVANHVTSLLNRTGAANRTALAAYARALNVPSSQP